MKRIGLLIVGLAVIAGAVAAVLATRSGASSDAKTRAVVMTAKNAELGKTILVSRSGLTLYSLSAERNGRFICTTAFCLSLWKPLVVPAGVKPTGVSGLAVVRRPDGKRQVAFKGGPLYRFVKDTKAGQVTGNGFRDVGVWRPVVAKGKQAPVQSGGSRSIYSY